MANFSSQEIDSQYKLIKMLLSDRERYKEAIEAIKGQFPIDDLRERLLAQQDLERTLLSLYFSLPSFSPY